MMRWSALTLALLLGWLSTSTVMASEPAAPPKKVVTYLSWTPTALYLAFRVDARMVVGNQTLPLGQPWRDDAVAIYLDLHPTGATNLTEHCVRVVVSAAGGATVQRADKGEWRDEPAWFQPGENGTIRYGVHVTGKLNDSTTPAKGYQVEMGLAWNLLHVEPPVREHPGDPLPTIGCALVSYAQGEGQAVSCWPRQLKEENLNNPSSWGRLQFVQNMLPQAGTETTGMVTLVDDEPLIDGEVGGAEWMTAGIVSFPKHGYVAPLTPVAAPAQPTCLVAAWYLLDPALQLPANAPFEPVGPWAGAETPYYHLRQIEEARRAGIDALAVVLPVEHGLSAQTRARLDALVSAVRAYDHAHAAKFYTDTISLLPILAPVQADLDAAGVQAALEAFYRLVPPQYRTLTPNAARRWCYPVVLTSPAGEKAPADAPAVLTRISTALSGATETPIGWLLDAGWQELPLPADALARCNWDAAAGLRLGEGPVRVALVSPGIALSRLAYQPRREGEIYQSGWLTIANAHPDIVLIRSWNDFTQGTEIAPSRRYTYQFVDSTRLATIRLSEGRGLHLRLLRHDLPPVLAPGRTYPVDLFVKNAGMEKLLTNEGIRVDYRITRGDLTLASGVATEEIVLLELSTARLRFALSTAVDRHHALPPGAYQLHLDFRQKKVPFLNVPGLVQTLGTLTLPLQIGAEHDLLQVLHCETPERLLTGTSAPVSYRLRRIGDTSLKGKASLRLRWLDEHDTPIGSEVTLTNSLPADIGDIATVNGALPPAPAQPGWYRLCLQLYGGEQPLTLHTALLSVTAADYRAQLLSIDLPYKQHDQLEAGQPQTVPVTLRNAGLTAWPAKDTSLRYQWLTWDGRAIPHAGGSVPLPAEVKESNATVQDIALAPPPGVGAFRCAFGLECHGQPVSLLANPLLPQSPLATTVIHPERYTPLDLTTVCNDWGAQSSLSSSTEKIDIDGDGNAFPLEEFLPDGDATPFGYQPGCRLPEADPAVVATAVGFRFAPAQDGRAPMIRAKGQEIPLPETSARALYLVALNAGHANPAHLTLRYAAGDPTAVDLNTSYWLGEPAFNEPVMLKTRYLRTAKGDDWYAHGALFVYRIPLDSRRKLKSLTLPAMPELCLFAITLEATVAAP